jgi:hypothetical protein
MNREDISAFSDLYFTSDLSSEMTDEQQAWHVALGRPEHNEASVIAGLMEALRTREINNYDLEKLPCPADVLRAWHDWYPQFSGCDLWDRKRIKTWEDGFRAWSAWNKKNEWGRYARLLFSARRAWSSKDDDPWNPQVLEYSAIDARDALMHHYAARSGWISDTPNLLTTGLRHAYYSGLGLVRPIGSCRLGWAMMDN